MVRSRGSNNGGVDSCFASSRKARSTFRQTCRGRKAFRRQPHPQAIPGSEARESCPAETWTLIILVYDTTIQDVYSHYDVIYARTPGLGTICTNSAVTLATPGPKNCSTWVLRRLIRVVICGWTFSRSKSMLSPPPMRALFGCVGAASFPEGIAGSLFVQPRTD